MKKFPIFLVISCLTISLSGCSGGYRYSCQDPKNWETSECNPPECYATGSCTKDIIGEKAWTDYQNSKGKK